MSSIDPTKFLGIAPADLAAARVVMLPLPFERTVSYAGGTATGPQAILDASCQIETYDEEFDIDYEAKPLIHTLPAFRDDPAQKIESYIADVQKLVRPFRPPQGGGPDRFLLTLGGEHLITYPLVTGLIDDPRQVTIVQIDAHADLIDKLDGEHWSHGAVMRRLVEKGAGLIQIGIRSLSRSERDFLRANPAIRTFFAHEVTARWREIVSTLTQLRGWVYLTIDVDGLDPSIIPSTGTPQPDGLTWRQTMDLIAATLAGTAPGGGKSLLGADVVEFIASPQPPGCDLIAAKLVMKVISHRMAALTR